MRVVKVKYDDYVEWLDQAWVSVAEGLLETPLTDERRSQAVVRVHFGEHRVKSHKAKWLKWSRKKSSSNHMRKQITYATDEQESFL